MEKCLVLKILSLLFSAMSMICGKKLLKVKELGVGALRARLSDSEIITMEIVGEFQGIDTDKGIWSYFRGHWLNLFPQMKSRSTFVRQAANLWCYKQKLQQVLAMKLGGLSDPIHLIDGIPIPLCHYQRAKDCRLFSGLASFGYCAAKDEKYYGFKGHLVMNLEGVITGFALTPALRL